MKERYHPDTRFAFLTKEVAESSFGIPVPQSTLRQWVILARGCGVADDVIDDTADSRTRKRVTYDLINFIEGSANTIPSDNHEYIEPIQAVRSMFQELPEEIQRLLIAHLQIFGRITEKTRQASNIREYSRLRMLEGQINMELFHDLAPESMRSYPNFNKYRETTLRMIRAGNSFDALIDLREDFVQGLTQVRPTVFNKAYLFKEAIIEMAKGVRGFNSHVIMKVFGLEKPDASYHKRNFKGF